jgi:hypothetical protein
MTLRSVECITEQQLLLVASSWGGVTLGIAFTLMQGGGGGGGAFVYQAQVMFLLFLNRYAVQVFVSFSTLSRLFHGTTHIHLHCSSLSSRSPPPPPASLKSLAMRCVFAPS